MSMIFLAIKRLSEVLNRSFEALDKGAVILIEESRHRIRHLQVVETGKSLITL